MNKFSTAISRLDLLSNGFSMKLQGESSYHTVIGGILTIFLTIITIGGILYFGSELWLRTDPSVISGEMDFQSSSISIGPQGFYFVFSIQNNDAIDFIDESYFLIKGENLYFDYNPTNGQLEIQRRLVEVKRCSTYFTSSSELSSEVPYNLENSYCLKPNTYHLDGTWGTKQYSDIEILIERCFNRTDCKDIDEISKIVKYLSININNANFYPQNFANPLTIFQEDHYNIINTQFLYDIVFYVHPLIFRDDNSLFLYGNDEHKLFTVDNPQYLYFMNMDESNAQLAKLVFKWSRRATILKRRYTKLQDVITRIGGLLKILNLFAKMLATLISSNVLYNDFLNNIEVRRAKCNPTIVLKQEHQDRGSCNFDENMLSDSFIATRDGKKAITFDYSNKKYNRCKQFKDFIKQTSCCSMSCNRKLKERTKNLVSKINHCLSIEVLMEKIFFLELMSNKIINKYGADPIEMMYLKSLNLESKLYLSNHIFEIRQEDIMQLSVITRAHDDNNSNAS